LGTQFTRKPCVWNRITEIIGRGIKRAEEEIIHETGDNGGRLPTIVPSKVMNSEVDGGESEGKGYGSRQGGRQDGE